MILRGLIGTVIGLFLTVLSAVIVVITAEVNASRGREPVRAVRPSWLPASWPEAQKAEKWRALSIGYSHTETFFEWRPIPESDSEARCILSRMTFGWPCPALERYSAGLQITGMHGRARVDAHWREFERAAGLREGLIAPSWFPRDTGLGPHIPVWPSFPGFALNTAIYGSGTFLLLAMPAVVRRRIRARRGQCLTCGYELGAIRDNPCPECGT